MLETKRIKRALISVSDKLGLVELARELDTLGIEILSTGGTLRTIREAGIHAIAVSSFTGSPEVLEGRVKTLHPKIHGGILFRRDVPKDVVELEALDTKAIDLVVVSLYPFEKTIANPNVTEEEAIENIDIGGPSMIRSAAKNFDFVTVIVDPSDYSTLIEQLRDNNGQTELAFRRRCSLKAFTKTAAYDASISAYYSRSSDPAGRQKEPKHKLSELPPRFQLSFEHKSTLRYGENPHQQAALYAEADNDGLSLVNATILSGKEPSYNNYGDLDACLDLLKEFAEPFACVVKHGNPCGAAAATTIADAYQRAYECDPLSAFGSIIGLNRHVDIECAKLLHETDFIECIVAPSYSDESLALLMKKKNRRLLVLPEINQSTNKARLLFRQIHGGLLVQTEDCHQLDKSSLKVATKRSPSEEELRSLLFAWKVVKQTKSNAIVLAKNSATVGIGMGQTSRVDSSFMAVKRAGDRARGAVLASDAFFPMPDGLEVALEAGVTAIIQPGGSKGDDAVIEAADKAGAAMVFTSIRHFKH
ncbi:MAG: bifunctional phosphoribosylaminoimidazolecarboxamide formyltransferase/IMP cyclohydrolase [candidate division Zixibacteria bacterium]|nr:bifunctional phosphoribosylaminoimidazolecarboxamide formyltransferase/IMP cyclohydrolase [candidate division Zixibacteria bacterium]